MLVPAAAGARLTSIPRSVDVLGELKLAEGCVHAVVNWTDSRAQAWGPYHDYAGSNSQTSWYQDMMASHNMMEYGRVQAGFRLLNISLRRFSADLLNERPLTLTGAYMCVLNFATVGSDLALSVLRHMVELSQVRLGPAHPYTQLWRGLVGLGIPEARRLARVVNETVFGFLLSHFGAHQTRFMYPHVSTIQELHAMGVISAAAAESAIRAVINTMKQNHPWKALDFACYARTMTAKIYTQDGQYDKASTILSEFEPHIHAHTHADSSSSAIDAWSVLSWYRAKSYVNQKLTATCSYEKTTEFFRARLDMCIRLTSPIDTWTTQAFSDLEEHYVAAGDRVGLARLREEYDLEARWDELCKRADKLAV
ncbi:Clr5 domain-containing protein [Apiospora arundinis]